MADPIDCRAFRGRLDEFLADEVPEAERRELQEHLDACDRCARRLEVERALLRATRTRLARTPAPPGLESRIRASLAEASAPRAGGYGRLWVAALATAALFALLLLLPAHLAPEGGGALVVDHLRVLVVDGPCDRAGKTLAQQRACDDPRHLNELKRPDGSYWNVSIDDESGRTLLLDHEMRGRRLLVGGEFFPSIRTLKVRSFKDETRTARRDEAAPAPVPNT